MPLVLVPLIGLVVAFFLFASLHSFNMTQRATLNATSSRKPSFLKTAAFLYKASGLKWVLHVTHVSQAVTSHFALSHLPIANRWLRGHTARVNAQAKEFAAISNDTADALGTLRHRTMPRAINAKVAPVRAQAVAARREARRSISLTRRETNERRRSIDRLRKTFGPLAAILLGIDVLVKGHHARAHHHDHTVTLPGIAHRDIPRLKTRDRAQEREIGQTRSRLKRVEKALAALVGGLVVYRVLARVAPWLFCRNWKKIGRAVCGLNPSRVDALLALLVGVVVVRDIRTLARFAEAVEDEAARGIAALVGVGVGDGGRFTIE